MEIQAGNNESLNHGDGSVCEKDKRDINKEDLIVLKDPPALQDEEKASLILSTCLMGLPG